MKKVFAISLAAALSLTALAACGEEEDKNKNNTKPSITGVQDTASVTAGTEFDALKGVSASDKEDGDVTKNITIESSPSLTFTNGKVTPSKTGDYEIIYTVRDSGGLEANAYCTLSVTPAALAAENVYSLDFASITSSDEDKHYWDSNVDTAEGAASLKQGAYVFDITNLNNAPDGDVRLSRTFNDLTPGKYKFVIWASSTVETYVHLIAKDASDPGWSTPGGKWNVKVGTSVAAYSTDEFELNEGGTSSLEFRVHMGQITPNPENPTDTSANAFSLAIEKIAIYKTTGVDTETDLYTEDFAQNASTVTVQAGDGAAATVSHENGAAKVNITSYHNAGEGGVWSLKTDVALGSTTIDEGTRYGYSIDVTAQYAQEGELLVESKVGGDSQRANFANLSIAAGETKTLTGLFVADKAISDPVLRFQIGNASAGVTNNVLTIDNVRFYKIEGNLRTDTVAQDKFVIFGGGSSNATNKAFPVQMENGSDGGVGVKGMGTAYIEGGKLIYKIHEGGEADYQSKLAFGYGDNPLELPGNAYYTFRIKMKASAEITFNFFVHNLTMAWDPGLIIKRATYDNNGVTVGTTETVLEFTTTEPSIGAGKFEALLQFGSPALSALGEVTIEISEFTVSVSRLAV